MTTLPAPYDRYTAVRAARAARKREQPRWFIGPVAGVLIALPLLILVLVNQRHLVGVLLAYLNLLILGGSAIYFVRQRTMEALIPVLFLTWLAFSWPLSSIYFASFYPDAYYTTTAEAHRLHLHGNERVQLTVLMFLVLFLPLPMIFLRRKQTDWDREADPRSARSMATVVLLMALVTVVLYMVNKLVELGPLTYVANGAFNYLNGLVFVIGVLFMQVPYNNRILTLVMLLSGLVFFSIGNARTAAVMPIAMFVCGLLFFGKLSQKWKTGLVVAAVVAFPFVLVIGDTTRTLLGGRAGGFDDFEQRLETMYRWQETLSKTPPLWGTFTRLFNTGGHSIITLTPDGYEYLDFNAPRFVTEIFTRTFVPGAIFFDAYYSTPKQLVRYDFMITDKTSVELSMLGGFWLIGGPLPVALGAVTMSVLHVLVGLWIKRTRRRAPNMALFMFGVMCIHFLWAQNYDGISYLAGIVRNLLIGLVLYYLCIFPFVREKASRWVAPLGYVPPPPTPPPLPTPAAAASAP